MSENSVYQLTQKSAVPIKDSGLSSNLFFSFLFLLFGILPSVLICGALFGLHFNKIPDSMLPLVQMFFTGIYGDLLSLAWFASMLSIPLMAIISRRKHLLKSAKIGAGRAEHVAHAKHLLGNFGTRVREKVPDSHEIKCILVEGKRRMTLLSFPVSVLALTTVMIAASLGALLALKEGIFGIVVFKLSLSFCLLALIAGGAIHFTSCITVFLVPVAWFALPPLLNWFFHFGVMGQGLLDMALALPVLVILGSLMGQLRGAGRDRMLVISSTGLFLAYPGMDGSVSCYQLDLTADVRAREIADGYMLNIPSGRTSVSFFLQSYVELERLVSGPPGTKQVLARVSSALTSGRVFAGFITAAAGLAMVVPYGSTILFSDYMTGYTYLEMKRPGVVGEARGKVTEGSSLFTSPAAGALRESVIAFQDERFTTSMNNADIAFSSCGGVGDTGAYLRGTYEGTYKIFCTRADDYLKENSVDSTSGALADKHYKRANFYTGLVEELMPDFPPSEFYYDLIIRHLRLAMIECDGDIPLEYQWLLVRIIGLQRFSVNIPLKDIDSSLLQNWYLESRRIFNRIEKDLPVDEARLYRARLLFREEKWEEATKLLKLLPGKKPWLMMASAARYTGSSLPYHLKRVREAGSSTPSLEFEATLLESLILGQLKKYKEAKGLLGKYAGDHLRGFQARALRILILNQGNLSTPKTEALEPKMRSSLAGAFQRVGDLPWSWWMTSVDLEYMAGIRNGRDSAILKRLSTLSWYPYKKRVVAHLGKATENSGVENGDLTSFLYQGYLEGVVDGL